MVRLGTEEIGRWRRLGVVTVTEGLCVNVRFVVLEEFGQKGWGTSSRCRNPRSGSSRGTPATSVGFRPSRSRGTEGQDRGS